MVGLIIGLKKVAQLDLSFDDEARSHLNNPFHEIDEFSKAKGFWNKLKLAPRNIAPTISILTTRGRDGKWHWNKVKYPGMGYVRAKRRMYGRTYDDVTNLNDKGVNVGGGAGYLLGTPQGIRTSLATVGEGVNSNPISSAWSYMNPVVGAFAADAEIEDIIRRYPNNPEIIAAQAAMSLGMRGAGHYGLRKLAPAKGATKGTLAKGTAEAARKSLMRAAGSSALDGATRGGGGAVLSNMMQDQDQKDNIARSIEELKRLKELNSQTRSGTTNTPVVPSPEVKGVNPLVPLGLGTAGAAALYSLARRRNRRKNKLNKKEDK